MNRLNLDPGLRQAFTQQTYQRLLAESTHARAAKSATTRKKYHYELKEYSLRSKIRLIAQIIQDAGSIIAIILRASNNSVNA
jgi:hypothetical protein